MIGRWYDVMITITEHLQNVLEILLLVPHSFLIVGIYNRYIEAENLSFITCMIIYEIVRALCVYISNAILITKKKLQQLSRYEQQNIEAEVELMDLKPV